MDNPPNSPNENKTLIGIATAIGGSACGVAFIFLLFSHGESAWPAALAITALAVMGIFFAHFSTKKN